MKNKILLFICVFALISACLTSCGKCEHTFSDEWYSDANNHWHPATCEHAETEKGDFAPHVDADENGFCDVCEYEKGHEHTYEDVLSFTSGSPYGIYCKCCTGAPVLLVIHEALPRWSLW